MRSAAAAVLALLASLAYADVLHMADGTTREGRVVEINEKEVVVDFGQGTVSLLVRLPRAEVVRVERKASPNAILMADYAHRLGKATRGTADDWHALGLWCKKQRCLNDKAREALERAIALDPNHAAAHSALGHVKLNDAWMTRERAIRLLAPHLAQGAAKARELAAIKEAEEAKAEALKAQKRIEQLEARITELEKTNETLHQRLAAPPPPPPPPPRPRVIYRPIIIFRDRPTQHSSKEKDDEKKK